MEIDFDPEKRAWILAERGLDLADAAQAFEGVTLTLEDDRFDYPEPRYQTYGWLKDRLVMTAPSRALVDRRRAGRRSGR